MHKIYRTTLIALAVVALAALALAPVAAADDGQWGGWITDANCGAKGANAEHKDCAIKCHKKGQALVLYDTDSEEMYQLSDQEMAMDNLGYPVVVKGELDGDTIQVASIEKAEMDGDMDDGMDDGMDDDM